MSMGHMTAQGYMRLWVGITLTCLFFLTGLLVTVKDLL